MDFASVPFPVWVALAFIWGAIWGSFGNVVIFRLPRGKSVVHPPSACPACHAPIKPWHNVPVFSWLWLRGRCATCKAPFSPRYALVEAASGLLAAAFVLYMDAAVVWSPLAALQAAILFFYMWLLLVLSGIDWDTFILPDTLTLGGTAVFSALFVLSGLSTLGETLAGAALGFFSLAFLSWLYRVLRKREGLGLGDAKLLALIGAGLGPWALFPVVFLAAVQGLFVSLAFLALRLRRDPPVPYVGISESDPEFDAIFRMPPETWMLTPMPFGPFLALGAVETFFLQDVWRSFLGI